MIGIYKFTNKVNNKSYIGQSVHISARIWGHFYRAFNNYESNKEYNKAFYRALRKYGKDNFNFCVLEECSKERVNEREIYWINYYDSYKNGYNETPGGEQVNHKKGEEHPLAKINKTRCYRHSFTLR